MFCFAYIEGLKDCPICGGAITGWDRTGPRKKPGPTRIGTKFDGDHGAVPANIVQVEAKSPDCPALEAEKADSFADDSSDGSDSDSDNGLVKWCGSKDFSNGGARTSRKNCVRINVQFDKFLLIRTVRNQVDRID